MTAQGGSRAVPDPLALRVRSTPDRTAVVDAAAGRTWRYDELHGAVDDLAARLGGLGLGPGGRLALLAGTSVRAVRIVHAGWRLGLRLVPLNVRLAEPELSRQVDRIDADALVCSPDRVGTAAAIADCPVASLGEDGAAGAGFVSLAAVEPSPGDASTWHPDDPALSMFTSGTTGEPKAVTLTMGNLLASATASAFRLGVHPEDHWLLCLPVYHMGGLAPVLRSALYGTGLVVREGFDPATVAGDTREHGATGLSLVPTQLRRILDEGEQFADPVRTVLVGGAPAPESLVERCKEEGIPIHPTYGLTETASQVSTATPAQAFAHPGTVGQPLVGTEVTIVDDDREPLPAGRRGEIVVAGPTVTPRYDDPATTEAAFCEHGLLTGDFGRVDEAGRLWVAGRRSDRIVTGGENVHPDEVVAAVEDHEAVSEVAVVGIPDDEWGERVGALIVPAEGVDIDGEAVRAHCRERLAGFKVPAVLRFADDLPRTASGTVDRAAVRERLAD